MKIILLLFFAFFSLCSFGQSDTLSYKVTSVYNNGSKRTDLVEFADGYINNAFYADGIHYCWTKKLDVNKKEKHVLEFLYSENYNFDSELTIKISQASYTETVNAGGRFYGSTTTIVTTNLKPKYELIKTIKVYKDKYIVYTYAAGQLLWTYFYDSKGNITQGTQNEGMCKYKIKDNLLIETSPSGEEQKLEIDSQGIARNPSLGINWAYPDLGTIPTRVEIPTYMDKRK